MARGTIRRWLGIQVVEEVTTVRRTTTTVSAAPSEPPPELQKYNPLGVLVDDLVEVNWGSEQERGSFPITALERVSNTDAGETHRHLWAHYNAHDDGRPDNLVQIADVGGLPQLILYRYVDKQRFNFEIGGEFGTFDNLIRKHMDRIGFSLPDNHAANALQDGSSWNNPVYFNPSIAYMEKAEGSDQTIYRSLPEQEYWLLGKAKEQRDEKDEFLLIRFSNGTYTIYRGEVVYESMVRIYATGKPLA